MNDPLRPTKDEAARAWAERVRANKEQVDRFREVPDGPDFYGPIASAFKADPRRTDDAILNELLKMVEPGDTWLDIGAGGGRFGLPVALKAKELIAVDPSEGMLGILREVMAENGIDNVRIVNDRWPTSSEVVADCSFIANVGMDIENFGDFLDAMEAATRKMCVTIMPYRNPTVLFDALWPKVHGEARAMLPALPDFLVMLVARGRPFEVTLFEREPMSYADKEQIYAFLRRQTWVEEGSAKDRALMDAVDAQITERDGRYALSWEPGYVGIVRWKVG